MLSREISSHLVYGSYIYWEHLSCSSNRVPRPLHNCGALYLPSCCSRLCLLAENKRASILAPDPQRALLDSFHLCRPYTRNTSLVTRAHTVAPSIGTRSTLAHIFTLFLNGQTHSTWWCCSRSQTRESDEIRIWFHCAPGAFLFRPSVNGPIFKLPPLIRLDLNGVWCRYGFFFFFD